jgi:protein SCO1/2
MSNIAKIALSLLLIATARFGLAGDRREKVPDPHTDFQAYTAYMMRQHFPNVTLINQDKKSVHFYDDLIRGKIVVIQFMFSNCEKLCPMVTPNLVKVQKELRGQAPGKVSFVSITVDPDHDTPELLKAYSQKFHVQPGWQFLTGSRADIDRIRRELGVYDPEDQQFEHMNVLTVGNEPVGDWFGIRALDKPDVIAYTVLRLTLRTASTPVKPTSASHARLFGNRQLAAAK